MKTIGIFGDSHADCTYLEWKTKFKSVGLGWPELLALKYKVKNYSAGGSGMFYSYDLFKHQHSNFDIIVYVPTQATRFPIYLPDEGAIRHMVPGFLANQAPQEISRTKKHNRPNDLKVIEAAISYSLYILDVKKEKEMKHLMLAEIKRTRPDTIIIPAFEDDRKDQTDIDLSHISVVELSALGTSLDELRKLANPLLDVRKCHMTDENNRMLFHKILAAIETNETHIRLSQADLIKPVGPFTKYFVDDNGRTNI